MKCDASTCDTSKCDSIKCDSIDFTETEDCIFCNKCYLVQIVKQDEANDDIDAIWDDYKNMKYIDSDSDFDDEDGKYCCNDYCCEPSTSFVETTSSVLCGECGTIQSNILSEEQPNNYTDGQGRRENKGQHGMPNNSINPYTDSLSTFIPKGFKMTTKTNVCEECGKYVKCKSDKTCQYCNSVKLVSKTISYDLSNIHMRFSYNHKEKSFDSVKNIMENMSVNYTKPLTDTALVLWAEIMKAKKLTRAGVRKGLIACCMYYSCLQHGCPRTPIEICKDFCMDDTKQFNKGDKEFRETFENSSKWSHLLKKTSDSEEFFIRFCNILDLEYSLKNKCNRLYNDYNLGDMEVVPKSAAAGIIFYICSLEGIKISKTVITSKLGVCNPTLTKTVKLIEKIIKKKAKKDKK